ncbi:lipocalin Cav p 2.0101-like [Lepus europaeus]|uniref:lipocalin Cav p 2.0101-like n=1 Tax=Lepus europaeus TaxID=9983 RepID=UPI002B46A5F9|nr:lipocalin Cav p 2.0101-like [Lepus europaeus]
MFRNSAEPADAGDSGPRVRVEFPRPGAVGELAPGPADIYPAHTARAPRGRGHCGTSLARLWGPWKPPANRVGALGMGTKGPEVTGSDMGTRKTFRNSAEPADAGDSGPRVRVEIPRLDAVDARSAPAQTMMKTMAMKMTTVTKALLLALAVGVACADVDPAQISGPWRTFAVAADNLDQVQDGGPHRMLLRHIECQEGCNALNVFFYVRKNTVCTPHTFLARKDADGGYTADFEGQNNLQLFVRDPDSLVVTNYNVGPDDTATRTSSLFVRLRVMNDERLEDYARLTEQHGIPRENILRVGDTDTCPP